MTQESNQNQPKSTDSNDRLAEIESRLSMTQLRFLIARSFEPTDKAAAESIGIKDSAVKGWSRDGTKDLIDEALRLYALDGVVTASEIKRRHYAKAWAVKVAGLDSPDERISQDCATEIIDRVEGKSTQRTESTMSARIQLVCDLPIPTRTA